MPIGATVFAGQPASRPALAVVERRARRRDRCGAGRRARTLACPDSGGRRRRGGGRRRRGRPRRIARVRGGAAGGSRRPRRRAPGDTGRDGRAKRESEESIPHGRTPLTRAGPPSGPTWTTGLLRGAYPTPTRPDRGRAPRRCHEAPPSAHLTSKRRGSDREMIAPAFVTTIWISWAPRGRGAMSNEPTSTPGTIVAMTPSTRIVVCRTEAGGTK